ncbi:MAG: hypothetical protein LBJ23_08870 [Tannerella sp.]|jgi:hypothetical protein|nr:hypothetical protein [Tannerella sp.]
MDAAYRRLRPIIAGMLSILVISSCNKLTPAGFWKNYRHEFIQASESDQGPWGGHRKIVWKYENSDTSNGRKAIDYAIRNGWKLTDSLFFANDSLMPLSPYGETDYSYDILKHKLLPSLDPGGAWNIYVFLSDWIAVEPGNARDTEKNGFVAFNREHTEFIVYLLWGE